MATKKNEEAQTPEAETVEAPKEKTVKIRLPKTKEDQSPVFVRVNQRTWLIQRGVTVEVPECVQEVLEHKERMEETIMEFDEANATK